MATAAGLPLPRLSRGRFAYSFGSVHNNIPLGGVFLPASSVPDNEAARMQCGKEEKLGWITAYTDEALLQACGVRIAFTERSGGASEGPFDSLNLKDGLGDERPHVGSNWAALQSAFGIGSASFPLINPYQVHGTAMTEILDMRDVVRVKKQGSDRLNRSDIPYWVDSPSARNLSEVQEGSDATLVNIDDVATLLCFADCLPLILVAPTGAFCVVHCGWKGTVAHFAAKAATRLCEVSGCNPAEINAYIGAYIHVECFEVSDDVAEQFIAEFSSDVVMRNAGSGRQHVNLGAAVVHDLLSCGCRPQRIADVGKCTACHSNHFFSYRSSGGTCGRHGAFAIHLGNPEDRLEYS